MVSAGKILQKQKSEQLTAVVINSNTAVTAVSNKSIDLVLNDFKHLTGGTDDRLSGWYASVIRRIGVDKFVQLAKTAEQEGKNPARYFSWLLKKEID